MAYRSSLYSLNSCYKWLFRQWLQKSSHPNGLFVHSQHITGSNAGLMPGQNCWRWYGIDPVLGQCVVNWLFVHTCLSRRCTFSMEMHDSPISFCKSKQISSCWPLVWLWLLIPNTVHNWFISSQLSYCATALYLSSRKLKELLRLYASFCTLICENEGSIR